MALTFSSQSPSCIHAGAHELTSSLCTPTGIQDKIVGTSLDFDPDPPAAGAPGRSGRLVVGCSTCSILVITVPAGTVTAVVLGHSGPVPGLAISPSGRPYYLTVSHDRTLRRWGIRERSLIQSVNLGFKSTAVAISCDESVIAVGHVGGTFTIWDLPPPGQLKFSPDGRYLAVATREQMVDIYDLGQDVRRVGTCEGHTGAVLHVDFSADGRFMRSSCTAAEVLHWQVPTGRLYGKASELRDVAWATHSVVFQFGLQGAWPPGASAGHIGAADVSNDREVCVTGDDSGEVRLFRHPAVADAQLHRQYFGAASVIYQVKFTHDDSYVISTGADGAVFQWRHFRFGYEPPPQPPPPPGGKGAREAHMSVPRRFGTDGGLAKANIARPKNVRPPPSHGNV